MRRLRPVVVVAVLWTAAFAGSSAPGGFGSASWAGAPSISNGTSAGSSKGKRWAMVVDPDGKRWDPVLDPIGKRWA